MSQLSTTKGSVISFSKSDLVLSPLGVQDPHYIVLENGSSSAFTISSIPGSYIPNSSSSLWIWQQADGLPQSVTRTFRTTFNLTGFDPNTASITGQWAADNFLDAILINGVSIGTIPNDPNGFNYISLTPFAINSGFTAGLNTLDFVVRDIGFISGFRVDSLSGTAQPISQDVPEPSAVLGLVLLGFGAFLKRK